MEKYIVGDWLLERGDSIYRLSRGKEVYRWGNNGSFNAGMMEGDSVNWKDFGFLPEHLAKMIHAEGYHFGRTVTCRYSSCH